MKIDSEAKRAKEVSMNHRFQGSFENGLSIIAASLSKKSGIKTEEKVYERVGRLKQKYPSISRYYQIDYTVETETVKNRKTKENTEVRKVKAMSWKIRENVEPNQQSGTYFLRTSLNISEKLLWMIYNIIREIEYSIRTLKTNFSHIYVIFKMSNFCIRLRFFLVTSAICHVSLIFIFFTSARNIKKSVTEYFLLSSYFLSRFRI